MIKRLLKAMMVSFMMISIAFSASKGWLADLRDLPTKEEIEKRSKHVDTIMAKEKSAKCKSINPRLRKMIFLHFAVYQGILNKRSVYLGEDNVQHWAHVFGMLLKESSGDTTSISSMTGRSYTTYQAKSDLKRWAEIEKLSKYGKIPLNYQTNFGLTQLSVDRLFVALRFSKQPAYLEGRKVTNLNTAIAARKLIWFYQDFAQGRLTQAHDRIHHHEREKPEYSKRLTSGIDMALLLCGTHYMFSEGYQGKSSGADALRNAMTSIAYCELGSSKAGYGLNKMNERCFAKWVTLCPTLNFDIAMLTPMRYFSTRNAAPVCEGTFKALLVKKQTPHKKTSPKKANVESKKTTHHQDTAFGSRIRKVLDLASSLFNKMFTSSSANP